MRGSLNILMVCGLLFALAGVLAGQALVEHAVAAAGGSVAGVAGKPVSDGINSVFGKVNKMTDKAAASGASRPANSRPAGVQTGGLAQPRVETAVRPRARAARPVPREQDPGDVAAPAAPIHTAPAAPVEPPPLTLAQIREIQNGASRQDVLARLGSPAFRITIPDGGHMLEVYRYVAKGEGQAALRLTDGVVSSVQVEAR